VLIELRSVCRSRRLTRAGRPDGQDHAERSLHSVPKRAQVALVRFQTLQRHLLAAGQNPEDDVFVPASCRRGRNAKFDLPVPDLEFDLAILRFASRVDAVGIVEAKPTPGSSC
jgi:hypothetical protein